MTDEVALADPTSLRNRIQTLIDGSTPTVLEGVVQHFVGIEHERRKKMLIDAVTRHGEAQAAFDGIKPDHRLFNEIDGVMQPAGASYTTEQKGKKEKAFKRLDRLTNTLTAAMTTGTVKDFKDLEEALKQND